MTEALEIKAYLASPVVGDFILPLDSILLSEGMKEKYGPLTVIEPGKAYPFEREICPLEIIAADAPYWFYAASFAQWGIYTEGSDFWNKRFDIQFLEYIEDDLSIAVDSGAYKAYHYRIFYRYAREIRWICLGDKKRIAFLLPTYLGKKISQGWGKVQHWEIKSIPSFSLWDEHAGGSSPMRAIPIDYKHVLPKNPIANMRMATFHPPYWGVEERRQCLCP